MFFWAKNLGLGLMTHAVTITVQPISKKWRSGLYSSKELSAYSREWSNTVLPYYALRKNRWTVTELFLCVTIFAKWVCPSSISLLMAMWRNTRTLNKDL